MTPEARDALEEMGIDAGPHRSKGLTRAMLREADVVFAMTRGHLEAIIATDPSSAGKVKLMDPGGSDVPDPIGGPIEDYRQTARSLRTMIQKRLDEIAAQDRA
jgi:protein-tyrosine-phosphatase